MSSSQPLPVGLESLLDSSARAAEDVCRVLRQLDDTSPPTLGGQWTVRDTAVHLIGHLKFYTAFLDGQPSPVRRWEDLELLNAAFFKVLDETDPNALADLVAKSAGRFTEQGERLDSQDKRPYHLGLELPVADIASIMCNELLMHGWDIAAVTGNSSQAAGAALPAVQHLSTVWPGFFRADLGDGVRFALQVDGLAPLVYVFGDHSIRLETSPSGADVNCATSGSAMNHLLWISARLSPADAKLTVSGIRPDLVASFGYPR
jgi:uncharacterized protein (TIGR03083 family)